jgi:hypothetical protein
VFDEIVGREVLKYEVFEPWCLSPVAKVDGTPIFGALAVHTSEAVLILSSNLRFSSSATVARSSFGLPVSVMPNDSWALKRNWLIGRSASTGVRPLPWYSNPMHGTDEAPYLPLFLKRKISAIELRPHDRDAISFTFEGHPTPVTYEYRGDFDGGIAWAGLKLPPLSVISPFLPMGEFAWLHPASKIEIRHPLGLLKSAVFEDWPLALRRAVFGHQESSSGEPLRSGAQLLRMPQYRSDYLDKVADLMQLRFDQHPALLRRLLAFSARIDSTQDYADLINERCASWGQAEMLI